VKKLVGGLRPQAYLCKYCNKKPMNLKVKHLGFQVLKVFLWFKSEVSTPFVLRATDKTTGKF
jgi:hypothetical protein